MATKDTEYKAQDDLDDLFSAIQIVVSRAKTREAAKKSEAGKKPRKPRGTKPGRNIGEDNALTASLVYHIFDETAEEVVIVRGLGETETEASSLRSEGHTLFLFTQHRSGNRMSPPQYYQLILDARGKKAGYRYFWRPTRRFPNARIVDRAGMHEFVTTIETPYAGGGMLFALRETAELDDETLTRYDAVRLGRDYNEEQQYLNALKAAGKTVIERAVSPDVWLTSLCDRLGLVATKNTVAQFRTYLERNVVSWPPTSAQVAILASGGTLTLEPDMLPTKDRERVVAKETEYVEPYSPTTQTEPVAEKPKAWGVFGVRGNRKLRIPLAVGTRAYCEEFIRDCYEILVVPDERGKYDGLVLSYE